ncbi:low affinity iron permease family protein [Verticiella sediminum]|uniref:Low affinity iron permease family protein n=1 Tax=Verticiella sediminum TaxID=1247510 RepID=A0A556AB39_9BURK|nr:low affinity iron permease family protein [Verticiella sediminum]TSH90100.1 low affinity iron permease family protein [Verticiella sediminum]
MEFSSTQGDPSELPEQATARPGSPPPTSTQQRFRLAAERISTAAGKPRAFLFAVFFILLWVASGPLFGFSDTWQLIINTGTTIVTFLMVFLIQNAQNRDAVAVQLKLDELIRAMRGARTGMINIDQLNDEELQHLRDQFRELGDQDGGDVLTAGVSTKEARNITVHATFDDEGHLETQEIDQEETREQTAVARKARQPEDPG